MSKLLQVVMERKHHMDESWMDSFERYNIDRQISFIYQQKWSLEFANRVFCFVVMAYDKDSGWIDIHKNRLDNKRKIMQKLGGDLTDLETTRVVENSSIPAGELKAWFMSYQRDWRWDTIMTCFDFHANQMSYGGFRTLEEEEDVRFRQDGDSVVEEKVSRMKSGADILKENKDKASLISEAIALRKKGEDLLEEIKKEFSTLDTALEKEGLLRMTDVQDTGSWETFIKRIRATE